MFHTKEDSEVGIDSSSLDRAQNKIISCFKITYNCFIPPSSNLIQCSKNLIIKFKQSQVDPLQTLMITLAMLILFKLFST